MYLWIINTLKAYGGMTFEELGRKWVEDKVIGGNPLIRSSFNRHRDDILDMLGIVIDCDRETYRYYIGNPEVLSDASVERWLYSTMTVHGMLADSVGMKERVVLENVPAGLQFLSIIIDAMRKNRRLRMVELEAAQRILKEGLDEFLQWYRMDEVSKDIRVHADRMVATANEESEKLLRSMPDLPENERERIRMMYERFAKKLANDYLYKVKAGNSPEDVKVFLKCLEACDE